MKVAAVTITYNRLGLTQQTIKSFYDKTDVDYHLFIDNGSNDGTKQWLEGSSYDHIIFEKNYGIAYAFREAVRKLKDYDFILKLDNDVETITDDIINKMLRFYDLNGGQYVCSPIDLNIDPAYKPPTLGRRKLSGYNVELVTHTGGAFQLIPYGICDRLCNEFRHLKSGDFMIGKYYRRHAYRAAYLTDLEMRHIGINQSCDNYVL